MLSKKLFATVASIFIVLSSLINSVIALDYNTYIYSTEDIVILSYEDNIVFDVYNSQNNQIYSHFIDPNGLVKGERLNLDNDNFYTNGVYKISSSSPKYSVLVGGAAHEASGVCGYYAMDPNGVGVAKEFYTYVPRYRARNEKLVIFAYEDDTAVTVETGNGGGTYSSLTSQTIDDGERITFGYPNELDNEWLHISADKPVSVLTAYDYGYLVPATTGRWSGKKFYTCINNGETNFLGTIFTDEQELIVSAFENDTLVTVSDTDSDEIIWEGLVDSGKSYIKNLPKGWQGDEKYYTIESDKVVSVTVAGPDKIHHQLLANKYGTGVGDWDNEIVGPSRGAGASFDNYLMILGYRNNTNVDCYDMATGELEESFIISAGKTKKIITEPSQWKIVTTGPVSVYSGVEALAQAEFVPLVFDVKGGLPLLNITAVIENSAAAVNPTDPNENEITYTIAYSNPITDTSDPNYLGTLTDLELQSHLTYDAYAISATPEGTFSLLDYAYSWDIGTLAPGGSGSVNFTVQVSATAPPLGVVVNIAELSNDDYEVFARKETPIACWSDDVVYVKAGANGKDNGSSWNDAYTSLYRAMNKISDCSNPNHNHEIWVAYGTYYPTHSSDIAAAFELIEGISLYGGFAGNETSASQRDWKTNECILTGGIGGSDTSADSDYVAAADNTITSATELDGFTITRATLAGLNAIEGCPTIYNCKIIENQGDGVYIDDAQAIIKTSTISDNSDYGIYCTDSGSLNVDRCKISDNDIGIDCADISSTVTNSWIHRNTGNGVEVGSNATIRNNTIVNNGSYGLYKEVTDVPTIKNTIIWDNGSQLLRGWEAQYCCVMGIDPNNYNINSDPLLAYDDLRDFHLSTNSPCIDAGDSTGITSELDLDNDNRIYGTQVDIGADEQDCTDVYDSMDFNADGLVNMYEFSVFSNAWDSWAPGATSDPNDAINWNSDCDFEADNHIDSDDIIVLADNWLWQACWREAATAPLGAMAMMSMPMTSEPATNEQEIMELEDTLLWFKMLNMDPVWESQLGSSEWYELIESIEETLETMKQ